MKLRQVGDPVRRRDYYLVTGVKHGLEQVEKAVLGATRNQYLVWLVVELIVPFELVDDCLLERRCSIYRSVLGVASSQGIDGCLFDVLGCIEVGLTGTEADEKGPEEVTVGWKAGVVRPIG